MKVAILQSNYIPWAGVVDMMDRVDVFVYHDDLLYNRTWRNRNRIRVPGDSGWCWLTVPVKLPYRSASLINQVRISYDNKWNRKHWAIIYEHYHKAPFFEQYSSKYKELLLDKEWERLVDLNYAFMAVTLEYLGLAPKIVHSEDLQLGSAAKNARIIKICQSLGADTWLANSACRSYIIPKPYGNAKIKIEYHDYTPPVYPQQYDPFVSHLSIVDMLFNCGPQTISLIRNAR
jgi:hypothetical protein